jgi:hypothetical protein
MMVFIVELNNVKFFRGSCAHDILQERVVEEKHLTVTHKKRPITIQPKPYSNGPILFHHLMRQH